MRVSADAYSLLNCYIVAVRHSAAGEVGEYVRFDFLGRFLTSSRVENIICAVAMGVVGIWCMHFVGYVNLCVLSAAIALTSL